MSDNKDAIRRWEPKNSRDSERQGDIASTSSDHSNPKGHKLP